jgi:hypothetical protein
LTIWTGAAVSVLIKKIVSLVFFFQRACDFTAKTGECFVMFRKALVGAHGPPSQRHPKMMKPMESKIPTNPKIMPKSSFILMWLKLVQ